MRTFLEMERDIESSTECAKAGVRHSYVRDGKPFWIFFTPPRRYQLIVCKKCGHSTMRDAIELVKKGATP